MTMTLFSKNEVIYMLKKSTDDEISYVKKILGSHGYFNNITTKNETEQEQNNLFALIRTNTDIKSVTIARVKTVDKKTGTLTFKHLIENLTENNCDFSYHES